MRKYIQITLPPEEVTGINVQSLMVDVMQALHNFFVRIKDEKDRVPIGLSFPEYDREKIRLGHIVRLHGQDALLDGLNLGNEMKNLRDYLHVSEIRPIPKAKLKGYVAYGRVHHGHGKEKLIKRRMKRFGISRQQAERDYSNYDPGRFLKYPFVVLTSTSTKKNKESPPQYPLYLKQVFMDQPGQSFFNSYGINPAAGVEYF